MALQPSLGHYYAQVNQEWRKGYEVQTSITGRYLSDPLLSHVVIISVSGGYNDYQVNKCVLAHIILAYLRFDSLKRVNSHSDESFSIVGIMS